MAAPGKGKGVIEELKNIWPNVAALSFSEDADKHQQFIQSLQQAIFGYVKQSEQAQQQQVGDLAQGNVGGQSTMGGAPQQGGMGGGPQPQQIGAGGGAGMSGYGASAQMGAAPDELQRLLQRQPAGA